MKIKDILENFDQLNELITEIDINNLKSKVKQYHLDCKKFGLTSNQSLYKTSVYAITLIENVRKQLLEKI